MLIQAVNNDNVLRIYTILRGGWLAILIYTMSFITAADVLMQSNL